MECKEHKRKKWKSKNIIVYVKSTRVLQYKQSNILETIQRWTKYYYKDSYCCPKKERVVRMMDTKEKNFVLVSETDLFSSLMETNAVVNRYAE